MFGYFIRILNCQCLVINKNIWVVEFCIWCLFVDVEDSWFYKIFCFNFTIVLLFFKDFIYVSNYFFIRICLLLFQVYYICIKNLMSTKCIQNVLRNLMKIWLFHVMDWLNVLLKIIFFCINVTAVWKTKNKLIKFFIIVSCQYMCMKSFQKQKRNKKDSIFTMKFNWSIFILSCNLNVYNRNYIIYHSIEKECNCTRKF